MSDASQRTPVDPDSADGVEAGTPTRPAIKAIPGRSKITHVQITHDAVQFYNGTVDPDWRITFRRGKHWTRYRVMETVVGPLLAVEEKGEVSDVQKTMPPGLKEALDAAGVGPTDHWMGEYDPELGRWNVQR